MTLSQEQLDSFWEQGYLRVGKILTDDEIKTYREEYDRLFVEANRTGQLRNLAVGETADETKKKSGKRMLQIMQVCERSTLFAKLNYDERILNIVEDLIGPNIMLWHDQALFKPALTGGPVFWHQDNAYWKCRPATMVSCWLTLDDAVRDNGAMQVIPGSHLKPVWHDPTETTNALVETPVDESKAVVVDIPAGGIMFHHCQTLHYTQPNETENQRRAFAIHFMIPGTRGPDGNSVPVNYHHPMLRARV